MVFSFFLCNNQVSENKMRASRLNWTKEEEQFLRQLRQTMNIVSWRAIAHQLNTKFKQKYRCSKQCRQRYINYVKFSCQKPKLISWSPEQNRLFFYKFMDVGSRWGLICNVMPGRSQNCLKNHFYGQLRKLLRKMNHVAKQNRLKHGKFLKVQNIIKIFQKANSFSKETNIQPEIEKNREQEKIFLTILSKDIIQLLIEPNKIITKELTEDIIIKLRQFSNRFKGHYRRKVLGDRKKIKSLNSQQALEKQGSEKTFKPSSTSSVKNTEQNQPSKQCQDFFQESALKNENNFLDLQSIIGPHYEEEHLLQFNRHFLQDSYHSLEDLLLI